MTNCVLVVAAHTDDEALGCGGTIVRHVKEGDTVYAVFMADGVTSRSGAGPNELTNRNSLAENASHILGIKERFYLGLPDNQMDSIPLLEVIQKLEPIIERLKPNIIYTHYHGDLNVDHRITHKAVMTACRPLPGSSVRAIYTFEVMSSTEWATLGMHPFTPDHFVNISDYLSIKLRALKEYQEEMREIPHSRNIKHIEFLAYHRGYSVGMCAAEAFMSVRTIR